MGQQPHAHDSIATASQLYPLAGRIHWLRAAAPSQDSFPALLGIFYKVDAT